MHLGAERILVIGAGRLHEPMVPSGSRAGSGEYPNLAQIAGHALSSIFLDALAVDIERLQRINKTLSLLPPEARGRSELRPIDVLVIAPSQRLDDIAARVGFSSGFHLSNAFKQAYGQAPDTWRRTLAE